LFVRYLREAGVTTVVRKVEPVTPEDLCSVHSSKYVKDVLGLRRNNGFGTRDKAACESFLYTNGSIVSATLWALTTKRNACSPTSGFHHAGYEYGGGFCTFNGLALATSVARSHGKRVAILDCDAHYGDGTEDIFKEKGWDEGHITFGARFFEGAVPPKVFSKWLKSSLDSLLDDLPDVLLYQAGADPHVDDPLGGMLTSSQMYERDKLVFETARERGVPVVWNLAGGYQTPIEKVLELHLTTARFSMMYGKIGKHKKNHL